ncbi:MAG: IPT/TIG domain-containing protein, partial [Myxococcota bacterium]|nr:IPT/TIG domain-containing protein [Myxococcota bacterium]
MKRTIGALFAMTLALIAVGCEAGDGQILTAGPDETLVGEGEVGYETSAGVVIAAPDLPLAITAVTPSSGPLEGGTLVSILGQGIGPIVEVRFGDALATNVAVEASALVTCVTPPGVTGTVDVSLRESDGQEAILPAAFEYVSPLAITQVDPSEGLAEGGYLVVVRGAGFSDGATVYVGGESVSGIQVEGGNASNLITMTMPPGDPGVVDVTVRSPQGEEVTLADAFERIAPEEPVVEIPPAIFSVLPAQGPSSGGTLVVLKGQGFSPGTVVRFGDETAYEVTVQSDELLTATTPPGDAGDVSVTVVTPGGETASLDPGFTYVDDATEALGIASVAPTSGDASGGFLMMVMGTGLDQVAAVTLGGEPGVGLTAPSSNTLVFTAPPHAAGSVDLVLTAVDGSEAIAEGVFEYLEDAPEPDAAPVLGSLSPASGPAAGGTPVLLVGDGFHMDATVTFGEADASDITWLGAGVLRVVTPASSAGAVSVTVTNPDGQHVTKSAAFTFVEEVTTSLMVASITPSSGPTTGGGLVTVAGEGFAAGLQLWFGPEPATNVTVTDETTAIATAPPGGVGTVDLVAVAADGAWYALEGGYSYFTPDSIPAQPPIISGILPASGWMDGGQTVLVTGVGLGDDTLVHFGSLAAEVVSAQGGSLLEVVTPAHAPGVVDVTVTSLEGLSTVLETGFVYFEAPPFIATLSPATGLTAGDNEVVIHGKNFADGATVRVGPVTVPGAMVTSSTGITLTMPPHAEGEVDITVTNPSGLADTLTGGYIYTTPEPETAPIVQSVVPADGPTSG